MKLDISNQLKFVLLGLLGVATAFAQTAPKPVDSTRLDPTLTGTAATANLIWHDVESWGLEGRAWPEPESGKRSAKPIQQCHGSKVTTRIEILRQMKTTTINQLDQW